MEMFNAGNSGNEDEAFDHIPARSDYKPKEMTHAIYFQHTATPGVWVFIRSNHRDGGSLG